MKVQLLVTDRVKGRELYMPLNSSADHVNFLTSTATDKDAHTPAYKELSVHLEVLAESGSSPLPLTNFRFGHPTPQNGVEVERKWKRADYHLPGSMNGGRLVQISRPRPTETEPPARRRA